MDPERLQLAGPPEPCEPHAGDALAQAGQATVVPIRPEGAADGPPERGADRREALARLRRRRAEFNPR
jgi:hypothetical protein